MSQTQKEYKTLQFQLIRHGESGKVFFVASGEEPITSGITKMTKSATKEVL